MTDERPRYWWGISAVAILAAGLAAGLAYNIGFSQGLAQVPVPAGSVPPPVDGWNRPGGFAFLFPLMFFAFWVLFMGDGSGGRGDRGAPATATGRRIAIASTPGIARRTNVWTGRATRGPTRIDTDRL